MPPQDNPEETPSDAARASIGPVEQRNGDQDPASMVLEASDEDQESAHPLADLPPTVRHRLELFMAQFWRSGASHSPFWEKVTPEHIPGLIHQMAEDSQLAHQDRQRNRHLIGFLVLVAAGVVVFLVVRLGSSDPDLLEKLVFNFCSFLGGVGAGFGIQALRTRNE